MSTEDTMSPAEMLKAGIAAIDAPRKELARYKLDDRELATVLAALRFWQREGWLSGGHEHDIATNNGSLKSLSKDEIDDLCERLNCGEA